MHCHLHRGDWSFHLTNEKKKKKPSVMQDKQLNCQPLQGQLPSQFAYQTNMNFYTDCMLLIQIKKKKPVRNCEHFFFCGGGGGGGGGGIPSMQ